MFCHECSSKLWAGMGIFIQLIPGKDKRKMHEAKGLYVRIYRHGGDSVRHDASSTRPSARILATKGRSCFSANRCIRFQALPTRETKSPAVLPLCAVMTKAPTPCSIRAYFTIGFLWKSLSLVSRKQSVCRARISRTFSSGRPRSMMAV
jgi:hypothetical protein